MLIKRPADIRPTEITDQALYLKRREFIKAASVAAAGLVIPGIFATPRLAGAAIPGIRKSIYSTAEKMTPLKDVTN